MRKKWLVVFIVLFLILMSLWFRRLTKWQLFQMEQQEYFNQHPKVAQDASL